jgi:4-alpha-glucanotransferase
MDATTRSESLKREQGGRLPRSSGVLAHVTSLPGPHGIGDLGPAAYAWIDLLADAGQTWWQILPLGPTGYGNSPYQCFSAFAGNPNLISLELLAEDGLLDADTNPKRQRGAGKRDASSASDCVDYDQVGPFKAAATETAWQNFQSSKNKSLTDEFHAFCRHEAEWLDPFVLFLAIKAAQGGRPWWEWPRELREYDPRAIAHAAHELAQPVALHKFRQFLFFRQWQQLRAHARRRGIRIIGDIPIFIASDSADAWSRPELFQLDEERRPNAVAGVPPDYFSETGQLWGNPLYDWPHHADSGYAWWIARLKANLELVDLVRLDHFRGFEAYWSVPYGDKTAENGEWVPGPGAALFHALKSGLGHLPLIAEDLGVITPPVDALRHQFDLPGMRVLQFAFGGAQEDRFFPHNYDNNTVVYTGTHDNETSRGWYGGLTAKEKSFFQSYAPHTEQDAAFTLIRLAWGSVADLAIAPLQDLLDLGNTARMNLPGTLGNNWGWRVDPKLLTPQALAPLAELTKTYQRSPA